MPPLETCVILIPASGCSVAQATKNALFGRAEAPCELPIIASPPMARCAVRSEAETVGRRAPAGVHDEIGRLPDVAPDERHNTARTAQRSALFWARRGTHPSDDVLDLLQLKPSQGGGYGSAVAVFQPSD